VFEPTLCDLDTTAPETDDMGITTCVATGGGGCSARLACPNPEPGQQTICGQLYDFESLQVFAAVSASGTKCSATSDSGPCALSLSAYDAGAFVASKGTAPALNVTSVYIDDCGRYRIVGVPLAQVTSQIVAIGVDDASAANKGPAGLTNAVGITTAAAAGATRDVSAFVVRPATASGWASSGGPSLSATQGILVAMYHGHSSGVDVASGVTFAQYRGTTETHAFYLSANSRAAVDGALAATSGSGAALVTIPTGNTSDLFYGIGGIDASCMWQPQAAVTVPYVVLTASFRPTSVAGMTCPL
jgi:hypothetical protein